MEITAKVSALEEEIGVLKGEIKSILQEVRAALLARDNPFTVSETPIIVAPPPTAARESQPVEEQPRPRTETLAPAPPVSYEPPTPPPLLYTAPVQADAPRPAQAPLSRGPLDAHKLAGLMAWTQSAAQRFTREEMTIVLSLARYGGYIETDLEATLLDVSATLSEREDTEPAGILDFMLALRQLEAVVGAPISPGLSGLSDAA